MKGSNADTLIVHHLLVIQNHQFAIYNGNEVNGPSVIQAGHAGTTISPPGSAQISPNMAYNNVPINDGSLVPMSGPPLVLSSINVDAFTSVGQTANSASTMTGYQSFPEGDPRAFRHAHSASLSSSVSSTNSLSGSPAPSLSGSDDSGNTSKSTVSRLSVASGAGRARAKSNASSTHSRRGSVSSVSHAGTPYALTKKDSTSSNGEKKFVCSYPGCTRAFSRNFNLSTHYVSRALVCRLDIEDSVAHVLPLPSFRTLTLASSLSHAPTAPNLSPEDTTALVTSLQCMLPIRHPIPTKMARESTCHLQAAGVAIPAQLTMLCQT